MRNDPTRLNPPAYPASDAWEMVFRLPRWRLRFGVRDLVFELRADVGQNAFNEASFEIAMDCAGSPVTLTAPARLIDAVLARAPDPVSLAVLSAEDAGLMLDHLLSPVLEALEGALNAPLQILKLSRRSQQRVQDEVLLQIEAEGTTAAIGLRISDPSLRARISVEIRALDAKGPPAQAGMKVAIGPVHLHPDDVAALGTGDQLLLDGANVGRLKGAVFLDETFYWPIEIIDGGIQAAGPLTSAASTPDSGSQAADIPVFFHVGLTGDGGLMNPGDRLTLQRLDDKRMTLNVGRVVIGRGSLVNLPEGIAVRVTEKEAA
jgi:Type III flagellar switch regulator (C-ring) FliN C-term